MSIIRDILNECNIGDNELKISRTTLWRLRKMGMPHIKVGSTYRYEKEDVVRWLKNSNALLEKIGYKEIQIDYSSTLEASEAINILSENFKKEDMWAEITGENIITLYKLSTYQFRIRL